MIAYDPARPLVFIHVPKCAGTSVRQVVSNWFRPNFVPHYFREAKGHLSPLPDIDWSRPLKAPLCIYGHFNRARGFGIEHRCAEASQFATILRDPFEVSVSTYHYTLRARDTWQDASRIPTAPLVEYLRTAQSTMLNHFPAPVRWDNYKEMMDELFVFVGLAHRLDAALARLAHVLGQAAPDEVPHRNATRRDARIDPSEMAALRSDFRARHALEYAVWDYAQSLWENGEGP